ncbi:MAG: AAA family ATPase [Patescibacteria group bacterium]|nr:AAA family ATPase [Patescibacteria group bacterium]
MSQLADMGAEKALVGSCLLNTAAIPDVMGRIGAEEFFFPPYRLIYAAIADLSLDAEPVTVATVCARLRAQKLGYERALDTVGGTDVVASALLGADAQEWTFWAKRVRQLARLRDLQRVAEEAAQIATQEPEDVDAAFAKVEEALATAAFKSTTEATGHVGSDELVARVEKYINDPDAITGMQTGWGVFDRQLDGLEPGNTTIVYAPSSHFKSMFVQNIGYRLAMRGYTGLWFTTEMPRVQVEERLLQIDTGLNMRWLRQQHQVYPWRKKIMDGMAFMKELPITIVDKTSLDIGRLQAEVSRHRRWQSIDYVIVDLVDHVTSRKHRDNETENQSAVMIAMKDIAKTYGVHILMTKHIVKRQHQDRKRSSFDIEDMRGSASYGNDVDTAISLTVFDYDNDGKPYGLSREEIAQRKMDDGKLNLLAWVAKNRPGDTGPMEFTVDLHEGGRIQPMSALQWVQSGLSA